MGVIQDALHEYAKFEDRNDDPSTPGSGEALLFFKSGKLHSRDSGGTVTEYGAGGGGGSPDLTEIEQITLGSTGPILFTAIPATFRHLLLVAKTRSVRNNATDNLTLRVGDGSLDTGSNYTYGINRFGTHGANNQSAGDTSFTADGLGMAGNTAVAGRYGMLEMWLYDYAGTGRRDVFAKTNAHINSSVYNSAMMSGQWLNTTDPIERIQVYSPNADLAAGSAATLYGLG